MQKTRSIFGVTENSQSKSIITYHNQEYKFWRPLFLVCFRSLYLEILKRDIDWIAKLLVTMSTRLAAVGSIDVTGKYLSNACLCVFKYKLISIRLSVLGTFFF